MTDNRNDTKNTVEVLAVSTPSQICAVDSVTGQPVYMTAMWYSNTVSEVQSALSRGFSEGSGTCIALNWYTGYPVAVGAKAIGYQDVYISTTSSSYIQIPMVKTVQIGSISFASTPAGAEIFLDGADQGAKTPYTISNVPVGTHAYTLKLAGYNDYTGSIGVALNQTATVSAALTPTCVPAWKCELPLNGYENDGCGNRRLNPACNPPQVGNISLASTPPGAEIFLDGHDQGAVTPNTVSSVPVGTHAYTLKLAGYNDYTGSIDVALNQTATVSAALIPACVPVWKCELPLNGYENDGCGSRRLNTACNPLPPIGQCIPSWQCELPLNGYENDGCGNRRLNPACNPPLPPSPPQTTGSVSFVSSPPGAEIYIDGHDQGAVTPYTISGIPAGDHTYTLKKPGYNDITGTVSVTQGQTVTESKALTVSPAVQKVTTGAKVVIGLMAAGVLATLGYMAVKKEPPSRTEYLKYPPGGR